MPECVAPSDAHRSLWWIAAWCCAFAALGLALTALVWWGRGFTDDDSTVAVVLSAGVVPLLCFAALAAGVRATYRWVRRFGWVLALGALGLTLSGAAQLAWVRGLNNTGIGDAGTQFWALAAAAVIFSGGAICLGLLHPLQALSQSRGTALVVSGLCGAAGAVGVLVLVLLGLFFAPTALALGTIALLARWCRAAADGRDSRSARFSPSRGVDSETTSS